jgi:hypothetical protein
MEIIDMFGRPENELGVLDGKLHEETLDFLVSYDEEIEGFVKVAGYLPDDVVIKEVATGKHYLVACYGDEHCGQSYVVEGEVEPYEETVVKWRKVK